MSQQNGVEITVEWIKEKLLYFNDLSNTDKSRYQALTELYERFRQYNPDWDDDELSNYVSYAETGHLLEYSNDIDESCKYLLDELNAHWE